MTHPKRTRSNTKLLIIFVAMIFVGLGNRIFQKLQTIPMRNYPAFLNLFRGFAYIPLSFAYILPMIKYGSAITPEQRQIPKRKFAIMGGLDSVAGIMQVFASVYLGGSLLILLGQASIPISMVISKMLLKKQYSVHQYLGATIVAIGLAIVIGPGVSGGTPGSSHIVAVWSLVMILSCIPMCLSSVYKEQTLGETALDPVYLNGWIAIFQFFLSLPLIIPAAAVGDPSISPGDLPQNLYDGMKCYLGHNTILDGPHKDQCEMSAFYVSAYLLFNVVFNILIVLILKFGSANILWLALTIMVPLGDVAFTFPFMPGHQPLHTKDVVGLLLIMLGLFVYRFLQDVLVARQAMRRTVLDLGEKDDSADLKRALLAEDGDRCGSFDGDV